MQKEEEGLRRPRLCAASDYELIFSCYEIRLARLPCREKQYPPALRRTGHRGGAKGDSELINLSPGLCLQSRFMSFIFGLRNEHAGTLNRGRLRSRVMVRIAHYILKLPASLKTAVCGTTSGIEVQRDRWLHLHWPGINNT